METSIKISMKKKINAHTQTQ